jgi:hypothetical protein
MNDEGQLFAITLHRVPRKDESWAGKCSKCGGDFKLEPDPKFEAQVRAMRN